MGEALGSDGLKALHSSAHGQSPGSNGLKALHSSAHGQSPGSDGLKARHSSAHGRSPGVRWAEGPAFVSPRAEPWGQNGTERVPHAEALESRTRFGNAPPAEAALRERRAMGAAKSGLSHICFQLPQGTVSGTPLLSAAFACYLPLGWTNSRDCTKTTPIAI